MPTATNCSPKGAFIKPLLAAVASVAFALPAYANPQDGVVAAGSASISAAGKITNIQQHTDRVVIDWRSFDISADELTRFQQPSSASVAYNRVSSPNPTHIAGSLQANGKVVLVNPNGVFFSPTARVDVGGIVATTADMTTADAMAGSKKFNRAGKAGARVVNEGQITASDAGLVGLVAPEVENSGTINARLGRAALASGDTATIDLYGDGLIEVAVADGAGPQSVINSGQISAAGGVVQLTAAAGREVVNSLVQTDGLIEAPTVNVQRGKIIISAEGANGKSGKTGMSRVKVGGSITAAGEVGGTIDITADNVELQSTARLDLSGRTGGGSLRVGGDYLGKNPDIQNAWRTLVEPGAEIKLDALENGNGGRAIFWADDATGFWGTVSAKGGNTSGNGGFVEVSGKRYLRYRGQVDTSAMNGSTGLLFLDPADIVILNGSGDGDANGSTATFRGTPSNTVGSIVAGDSGPSTLYESELQGIGATTNVSIAVTNGITINNLTTDGVLSFAQTSGRSVTFTAGSGGVTMANTANSITTAGGALNFTTSGTGGVTLGNINTNGGLLTLNLAGTSTISGIISGTGGLSKSGTGTLTLSNANTYSGATTLLAGITALGSNTALGTGAFNLQAGTLQASGGARTIANTGNLTFDSTIAGTAALTFTGSMTLNGNRQLTVNNTALTTFNNVNLSNSGTPYTFTVRGSGNVTIGGVIANGGAGAGGLTLNSTSTLTLAGANTYSGTTTLTAGTLAVGNNAALGTGTFNWNGGTLRADTAAHTLTNAITMGGDTTIGGSLALTLNGTLTQNNNRTLTINNSALTTLNNVNLSNSATPRVLTVRGSGNTTIGGVIANGGAGAGGLTLNSTSTLTLAGTNTYSGTTTLTAGTLAVGNNAAIGTGTLNLNGGTLRADTAAHTLANTITMGGNATIGGSLALTLNGTLTQTGARTLTVNNSALTTLNNVNLSNSATPYVLTVGGSGSTAVSGVIANGGAGAGGLTLNSTGTLTLAGTNTYSGATTLTAGTLAVGNNAALGTGTLNLNGGTLRADTAAHTLANTITMGGNAAIGGSLALTLNGTLTQTGARTLTVNNSALTTLSNVNLSNSATPYVLTIGGTGNTTIGGIIANGGAGAGGLTKSGTGVLTLSGVNTYTGATTIGAGSAVRATNASALGAGALTLSGANGRLELAADADTNFGRNTTVSANFSIYSDRLTSGAAVTHTLGTLSIGINTLSINAGGNVTSGTSQVSFGNTSVTNNPTFSIASGAQLNLGALSNGGTGRAVVMGGGGILQLNGGGGSWTNTTNTLTINQGAVRLGATDALGTGATATAVTVNSTVAGATALFDLNGFNQFVRSLTFGGTGATSTSTNSVTTGSGTLSLAGDVTVTATNNPLPATISGNLAAGVATRIFNVGDSSNAPDDLLINATISGTGFAITKSGAGRMTLSGNNTYTGVTTLTAGTLAVGNNAALGTGTFNFNGGTLQGDGTARTLANVITMGGNAAIGGTSALTLAGALTQTGARTLTVDNTALTTLGAVNLSNSATPYVLTVAGTGNLTIGGIIANGGAGAGGITKNGTGRLTLSGANTYTGATTLSSGTLSVATLANGGSSSSIGSASNAAANLVLTAGTLEYTGATAATDRNFTLTATTIDVTSGAAVLTLNGASSAGAGTLAKAGPGTLVLGGANAHTGTTTVQAGTLRLGAAERLTNSSALVVNSGSSFDFNNFSETLGSLSASGTVLFGTGNTITTTTTNAQSYSGQVSGGAVTLASTGGGNITAANSLNNFTGNVAVSTTGSVSLADVDDLSLGSISAANLLARALGGDLTLNGAVAVTDTSGTPLVLTGANFINNAGASALSTGTGARWLVYYDSPVPDTRGGLTYAFKQYNTAYGASILGSGNGFVHTIAPIITPILIGAVSRGYDGTVGATLLAANYGDTGSIDGDVVTLTSTGATFDTANAGTGKTITATGVTITGATNGGATIYGYQLGSTTATGAIGEITAAALTVSTSAVSRGYDGSLTAAGVPIVTSGTLYNNASNGGVLDSLSGGSFAFLNSNAGTGKTVTVGGVTVSDGNGGNNYAVTYADNTTSIITPEALTVSTSAVSRGYDGSLTAVGVPIVTSGTLYNNASNGGVLDSLTGGSFAFLDSNAGTGKTVTVGGVTVSDGNGGNNYVVTYADNTTSIITPAALTLTTTPVVRPFDGTTNAAGSVLLSSGTLYNNASNGGVLDSLVGGVFAFLDPSPGINKTVTVSGASVNDGNGGNNYTLAYLSNTTSEITALAPPPSPLTPEVVYASSYLAVDSSLHNNPVYLPGEHGLGSAETATKITVENAQGSEIAVYTMNGEGAGADCTSDNSAENSSSCP